MPTFRPSSAGVMSVVRCQLSVVSRSCHNGQRTTDNGRQYILIETSGLSANGFLVEPRGPSKSNAPYSQGHVCRDKVPARSRNKRAEKCSEKNVTVKQP